jgi:hypothetical protein
MEAHRRRPEIEAGFTRCISSLEAAIPLLAPTSGLDALQELMVDMSCSTHFLIKSGPPPDGIVAYLTRKCGTNPARNGIVDVTLSSRYNDNRLGPNVFDFMTSTDACATSGHTGPPWISFDFQGMSVVPTAYWIRSWCGAAGSAHPKSWVLEGCQDPAQQNWVELDRRDDTTVLNGVHAMGTFTVSQPRKCQILRLRATSPTHHGSWYVVISGFEIFGYLRE